MSHIAKISVEVRDLEALRAACNRIGCTFVSGQTTYCWYGRFVGDTKLPDGVTIDELGHCEHAIQVPGAKYEIGVRQRRDGQAGYTLLWDFYGPGGLERALGKNGQRLIQAYGVEAASRAARRAGYTVTESSNEDGSVTLRVRTGGMA